MNNTIKELNNRKSVRVFLDKEISDDDKKAIINCGIQAPTAGNMVLYSIIDVVSQEKKDKLSDLCDHQPMIKNAKMVLVFLSDCSRWYKAYNKVIDKELKPTISDYFLGVNDALISAQNCVTAAESIGIGSCYIGDVVENYEQVKELLNLNEYAMPVCMLIFGYPTEQQKNRAKPIRFAYDDIVFEDTYFDNKNELEPFENWMKEKNVSSPTEEAEKMIKRLYSMKQSQPFFGEMNRSLSLMIEKFEK